MYIIKSNKNSYIRLNGDGIPVSCTRSEVQVFDKDKANNILGNLPKSLKKFKFKIVNAPDDIKDKIQKESEQTVDNEESSNTDIINCPSDYKIAQEILRWVEKIEVCESIANEIKIRLNELNKLLSSSDKEVSNLLHKIEIEPSQNAVNGYYCYKKMREVLQIRRKIKDEMRVLKTILKMNFYNISSETVRKCINGLSSRKFTLRSTEFDDIDAIDEVLENYICG